MGEFFFCFSMPLFLEGFMEFKGGGGSYYFFKEGDLKTIFRGRGGGLLLDPPPFFTLSVSHRFAEEI
jgi:hypothetical protein